MKTANTPALRSWLDLVPLSARAHRRRIPEKVLFGAAWLGGAPGCLAGMYLFRHKTRHWYFRWGMPLILLIQLLAGWVAVRMKWLC